MSRLLIIAFDASEAVQLSGFASSLGLPFDVLQLAGAAQTQTGAEKVFLASLEGVPTADGLVKGLTGLAGNYTHFAAVSSMASKDALARLAGKLDAAMVTDVLSIESPTMFLRPMVAGSLLCKVEVLAEPVVMTVRPAGFPVTSTGQESLVEMVTLDVSSSVRLVARDSKAAARPDLSQAKIVVSGGRPLGDAATFERVIGGFADSLGAAVGATRAAVDSGIAANELQVGQTGKIVAPDLYIAAGISGSTQHMAGIKDSKLIVAINKDPDAPIFETADLGLVGDLFEVLPALQTALGK